MFGEVDWNTVWMFMLEMTHMLLFELLVITLSLLFELLLCLLSIFGHSLLIINVSQLKSTWYHSRLKILLLLLVHFIESSCLFWLIKVEVLLDTYCWFSKCSQLCGRHKNMISWSWQSVLVITTSLQNGSMERRSSSPAAASNKYLFSLELQSNIYQKFLSLASIFPALNDPHQSDRFFMGPNIKWVLFGLRQTPRITYL